MNQKKEVSIPPKPEKVINPEVKMGRASRRLTDKVKRHQQKRAAQNAHELRVHKIKLAKIKNANRE